jgi:hypothetical protein
MLFKAIHHGDHGEHGVGMSDQGIVDSNGLKGSKRGGPNPVPRPKTRLLSFCAPFFSVLSVLSVVKCLF